MTPLQQQMRDAVEALCDTTPIDYQTPETVAEAAYAVVGPLLRDLLDVVSAPWVARVVVDHEHQEAITRVKEALGREPR